MLSVHPGKMQTHRAYPNRLARQFMILLAELKQAHRKYMDIGQVTALATRPACSAVSVAADRIEAVAGAGLLGDRHADPLSPRQVLLASASAYADLKLPAHALGENLLLDFDTAPLRSGAVLRVGDKVLLRLMFQCEACGYLDAYQAGVSGRIGQRRGILARVLSGGIVRSGDRIVGTGCALPAWSDDWKQRVAQVVRAVPDGMVVTYAQLARLAGVQSVYCRAFPRLLKSLGLMHKAASAQAAQGRQCWDGHGLFDGAAYSACSS
jgi:MOSC domain-containing protein YiiM